MIDYKPFDGDGRHKRTPMLDLPHTHPIAVTNGQARRMIDAFNESGHSTHSAAGSTLWVMLVWLQRHDVPYSLRAQPGCGYFIKKDTP